MSISIPANRFMTMLRLLPRWPGFISTAALKDKLCAAGYEVSLRTVQLNLERLQETEPGLRSRKSGRESSEWFFEADAPVVIVPSLDDHTALAFELADAFLREVTPPETIVALKPFVVEAGKRLTNRSQIAAAKWKDKIHVFPLGLRRKAPRIRPEVRDVVYQALLDEQAIRIFHMSRGKSTVKEFVISPLGLVVRDYVVYLYGLTREKQQVLAFALHRTCSALVAPNEPYVRPEGFVLQDHENLVSMPIDGSPILQLKMRIDLNSAVSLRECPLAGRQTLEPDTSDVEGKGFILRADVPNTVELRQWIRSLGAQAQVLEPGHLRAEIADELEHLSMKYRSNP